MIWWLRVKILKRNRVERTIKGEIFNLDFVRENKIQAFILRIPCRFGKHKYGAIHQFGFGWSYMCANCDKQINVEEYQKKYGENNENSN